MRLVVLFVVLPILLTAGGYAWLDRVADQRWASAQSRIRQLSAPSRESRPRSDSEAARENQNSFVSAIRLVANSLGKESAALLLQRQGGEALDSVLNNAHDFLDRLHQGARRAAASPAAFPPPWRGYLDTYSLSTLMQCGVLRARRQRERNRPFEAAETLMDLLQLGRFCSISGTTSHRTFAMSLLLHPLEELRDLLSRETLSAGEFRDLERELEAIDEAIPSPLVDIESAVARWAESLELIDPKELRLLDGAAVRWRFLPARLMNAEALEFADRHVRLLREAERRSCADLLRQLQETGIAKLSSSNPQIQSRAPIGADVGSAFERKAAIRLLRMAAHYRATGEVLKLEDPFGTTLRMAERERGMTFWSLGADGKDDGGSGAKDGRWLPGLRDGSPSKDVTIEVPRPP